MLKTIKVLCKLGNDSEKYFLKSLICINKPFKLKHPLKFFNLVFKKKLIKSLLCIKDYSRQTFHNPFPIANPCSYLLFIQKYEIIIWLDIPVSKFNIIIR